MTGRYESHLRGLAASLGVALVLDWRLPTGRYVGRVSGAADGRGRGDYSAHPAPLFAYYVGMEHHYGASGVVPTPPPPYAAVFGWREEPIAYWCGLHELGHHGTGAASTVALQRVATESAVRYGEPPPPSFLTECEALCWEWAAEHSIEPMGHEVREAMRRYVGDYARNSGPGGPAYRRVMGCAAAKVHARACN